LIAVRHASTSLNTDLLLTETLGSVLASMSSTAGSAWLLGNQVFGPYGKQRYSKGTIPTTKGYTGQYGDALTGLDSYVARYYDAVVGRFLSADTVESNLEGMDPYAYVGGNPQTKNDPSGHCPLCLIVGSWVIGGALVGMVFSVGTYIVSSALKGEMITQEGIAHAAIVGALTGAIFGPAMGPPTGGIFVAVGDSLLKNHLDPLLKVFFKDHCWFMECTGTAHAPSPSIEVEIVQHQNNTYIPNTSIEVEVVQHYNDARKGESKQNEGNRSFKQSASSLRTVSTASRNQTKSSRARTNTSIGAVKKAATVKRQTPSPAQAQSGVPVTRYFSLQRSQNLASVQRERRF
jgi:RHS repeat-associated protein